MIENLLAGDDRTSIHAPKIEGLRARAESHLIESIEIKGRISEHCMTSILETARLITETFRSGGKLLLCGNGGSAADCQHIAAEFVNRLSTESKRPGLAAIALTTDTSFLTSFANDSSFEGVFERQVKVLGKPGDLLIGISTSGDSQNVIRALEAAEAADMRTVFLTGSNNRLVKMADITISVPSHNTQYIQEAHLSIEHIVCDLVERSLFGDGDDREIESN
ncbi:MAG: SIS domain-containing protein [Anaerolineales bacterium]